MEFQLFIERVRSAGIKPKSRQKITANKMYPWGIERKLQHQLVVYFDDAGEYFMKEALRGTSYAYDDVEDLTRSTFSTSIDINNVANEAGYAVQRFQQQSFENFTDVVIGARYIPSSVNPSITKTWSDNFVNQCKSTTDEMKKKISSIVSSHLMQGGAGPSLRKQIQQVCHDFSRGKAQLIARTETAKLNMAISKAQMEEAGIELYEWACVMDERSRKSHMAMDGKICSWSNPDIIFQKTTGKFVPRIQAAVHKHPGDDYNCRCIALPWDPLIDKELNQKKGKPNKAWLEMQQQAKEKQKLDKIKANKQKELEALYSGIPEFIKSLENSSAAREFNRLVIEPSNFLTELRGLKIQADNPTDYVKDTADLMKKISAPKTDKIPQSFVDVNPLNKNPFYMNDPKTDYENNCAHVVCAAEMQYRGYKVFAQPLHTTKNGMFLGYLENNQESILFAFKNAIVLRFETFSTIRSKMKKWGNGSRAIVGFRYYNGSGHVLIAEQVNGETIFKDFQSKTPMSSYIDNIDFRNKSNFFYRVDNLSPTDLVLEAVEI